MLVYSKMGFYIVHLLLQSKASIVRLLRRLNSTWLFLSQYLLFARPAGRES